MCGFENIHGGMMSDRFPSPARGDSTPWGEVWEWRRVVDGVFWVSTPAHGGLLIAARLAEETLSAHARTFGTTCGIWLCFEEDCEISIPLFECPLWGTGQYNPLRIAETIRMYFPDYFLRLPDVSSL
jgi:hypothetical protein